MAQDGLDSTTAVPGGAAQPGAVFSGAARAAVEALLAPVDAELARRYPGDSGTRQPVHTVYVPADAFDADTVRDWGRRAVEAFDTHAATPGQLGEALGLPDDALLADVHARVRAKLEREPVEDLRVDFEDGYGPRPDDEEDAAAIRVARLLGEAVAAGTAPPYVGVRIKCMEAAVRERGIRTLELFLGTLLAEGASRTGWCSRSRRSPTPSR